MAIKKKVRPVSGGPAQDVTMPVFSYGPNDGLAQMIVEAWTNQSFRDALLKREADHKTVTASGQ
jgi:hypothetical protein